MISNDNSTLIAALDKLAATFRASGGDFWAIELKEAIEELESSPSQGLRRTKRLFEHMSAKQSLTHGANSFTNRSISEQVQRLEDILWG